MAASTTPSGDQKLIVVAEDSAVNRKILVHLLVKMGFAVSEHENGSTAWEDVKANKHANVIAVFSDIMMPEMDGLRFLKSVRTEGPNKDLPFVLLTAVSDKESIKEARAHKVNGYLLKPVSYDKVKKKLEELFPEMKFPAMAG